MSRSLESSVCSLNANPSGSVTRIVAGSVLPMLGELHAEPVVRALVQAGEETLDHELGHEVEPLQLGKGLGIEDLGRGVLGHGSVRRFTRNGRRGAPVVRD